MTKRSNPERELVHELANRLTVAQGGVLKVMRQLEGEEADILNKANESLKTSFQLLRELQDAIRRRDEA